MKTIIAVNSVCEFCSTELIQEASKSINELPMDQRKTQIIHKILHDAEREATKPCIQFPCHDPILNNITFHNICVQHLYKMIDAVKKYEEECIEKE